MSRRKCNIDIDAACQLINDDQTFNDTPYLRDALREVLIGTVDKIDFAALTLHPLQFMFDVLCTKPAYLVDKNGTRIKQAIAIRKTILSYLDTHDEIRNTIEQAISPYANNGFNIVDFKPVSMSTMQRTYDISRLSSVKDFDNQYRMYISRLLYRNLLEQYVAKYGFIKNDIKSPFGFWYKPTLDGGCAFIPDFIMSKAKYPMLLTIINRNGDFTESDMRFICDNIDPTSTKNLFVFTGIELYELIEETKTDTEPKWGLHTTRDWRGVGNRDWDLVNDPSFREFYATHPVSDVIKKYGINQGQVEHIVYRHPMMKRTDDSVRVAAAAASNKVTFNDAARKAEIFKKMGNPMEEKYGDRKYNVTKSHQSMEKKYGGVFWDSPVLRERIMEGLRNYHNDAEKIASANEKRSRTVSERYGDKPNSVGGILWSKRISTIRDSLLNGEYADVDMFVDIMHEAYGNDMSIEKLTDKQVDDIAKHASIAKWIQRLKDAGIYDEFIQERYNAIKETMHDRYDVSNPFELPEIQDKIRNTNLTKYGVAYQAQRPEIKKKISETFMQRYGKSVGDFLAEYEAACVSNGELELIPYMEKLGVHHNDYASGEKYIYIAAQDGKRLCPDFISLGDKIVVEYDGEYYHRDPSQTEYRQLVYQSIGFDCCVVWESERNDFIDNPPSTIDELKARFPNTWRNKPVITGNSIEEDNGFSQRVALMKSNTYDAVPGVFEYNRLSKTSTKLD